jgi:hypothetical protein
MTLSTVTVQTTLVGEACLSEERVDGAAGSKDQAEALPSEAAMASGTPNSLIITCSAGEMRALRASRSCHERRVCARCARERDRDETMGVAEADPPDSVCTSTRWW